MSVFGRLRWRDLATNDQPPVPLPSGGGGNGSIYARNKQLALGMTWVTGSNSLLEARFGWSQTTRRQESAGARQRQPARRLRHQWTAERSADFRRFAFANHHRLRHRAGQTDDEPAVAVPDGVQSEAELHPGKGRQSLKAGYEFQRINIEVQDVNPLYGRTPTAVRSRSLPTRRRQQPLQPGRFHARPSHRVTPSATCSSPTCGRTCTSHICRTTVRLNGRLTLNLGLRYEYATPQWETGQRALELGPCDSRHDQGQGRIDFRTALVDPDRNNLGPRLGFA